MNKAMIDIETLATSPSAAVLSIGVAVFDESAILQTQGWAIRAEDWHGDVDTSTVKWWTQQTEGAREYSFNGTEHAATVAAALSEMMRFHKVEEFWANDPEFDLTILRQWWARTKTTAKCPFHYRQSRSCRTLYNIGRQLSILFEGAWQMNSTAHNPVDDASNQARAVIMIAKQLRAA